MRIVFLSILVVVALFGDGDDYKDEFHLPNDLSFLNLDSKQKIELKKILKEHRKSLKILHKKEEKWEESLKKEFSKDRFDIDKFIKESLKLKEGVVKIEANFFKKIHSILNPNQRKKFIEYIEEWEVE